ncbi:hypothetical protein A9Z42_0032190 [Trichoderma parareesei]|uniref:ABM domain-containing protein n=1 Tax=Trichoderma parareesei TaxID=858221 RepID=A0A2H2ZU13_TRIPA|nr:hypothetical protein A9Z42_0032190 [Trichoderma parareesei]
MSELIEISTFTLKINSPVPPPTLISSLKLLSSAPGLIAIYFGPHIESPTTYTTVTRWSSQASRDAFFNVRSPTWQSSFTASLETLSVFSSSPSSSSSSSSSSDDSGQDAAIPLGAPCTEIFFSFGADEDYLENRLNPFVKAITSAKLPGLFGGFTAEFVPVKCVGVEKPEPKTVVLMMGWNSKADHEAQKGQGTVIDNNIHLIRSGRKAVSMFHVNFKKL